MADTSPGSVPSSDRNLMIVCAYLWFFALIPLLTKGDDKELQWHCKNGLALMVCGFAVWALYWLLLMALGPVGCIVFLLSPLLGLTELALHVYAIVKGINGERLVIPGVSGLAEKF